jgi:hypothetical protein
MRVCRLIGYDFDTCGCLSSKNEFSLGSNGSLDTPTRRIANKSAIGGDRNLRPERTRCATLISTNVASAAPSRCTAEAAKVRISTGLSVLLTLNGMGVAVITSYPG